jgi:predicted transcriptional regulator
VVAQAVTGNQNIGKGGGPRHFDRRKMFLSFHLGIPYAYVYITAQVSLNLADSVTLTVRLRSETKDQLAVLAGRTRRTSSFLAAEAIADYVARELAIVEGIEQGRGDIRAGRVVTHAGVSDEARAIIKAARPKR